MGKSTEEKLASVRASIKRWQTRAKRANSTLAKLYAKEQRLMKPVAKKPAVDQVIEAKADLVQAVDDRLTEIIEGKPSRDLDIPLELKREPEARKPKVERDVTAEVAKLLDPAAEVTKLRLAKMDAKRRGRSRKEIDKTAMPLTDREAMKAIRAGK